MTTIVVPLDGSVFAERAIRPACSIAARVEQARVLLVSCAPDGGGEAQDHLDDRASLYREVVDIGTRIVDASDPAAALLAIAAEEPDGMLCMSTRGKGGLRAAVLGSVSTQVVCRSTQPLVLVGPACRTTLLPAERGRLLVCSDGSALSDSIITTVATWCDQFRLEPWLTEVVGPDENVEPSGEPPRNREVEAASARLDVLATRLHSPGFSREDQSPPRRTGWHDPVVRGASAGCADRPRDSRPERVDPHRDGQRCHRSRPPRPVSGADHAAHRRSGVNRRDIAQIQQRRPQ